MVQRLRIFLSSPGDVASAREVAAQTIEKLAQEYARHFESIEPYLWEHEAMLASGHFQDSIEPPSAFDIVVLVLWSRLGTPLPKKTGVREYRGIDGRAPVTGTEWEYEEALRRARDEGAPDLLVFRNLRPANVDTRDPQVRDRQLQQLQALDRFWSRHFANQGVFLGAYTEFSDNADFAAALESQLRKLIEKRLADSTASQNAAPRTWSQDPFRGLESYEFEHAPIFFGQDDVVGRAMLQLADDAEGDARFLLVLGASGSGKSSLVKAGIVPKLFVPRRMTGAAFLRRALFRPSDAAVGEDIFDALARQLTTQVSDGEGLAELISREVAVEDLAAHLRGASAEPSMPFRLALGALAAEARRRGRMLDYETARLVLVVDQLEELFTNERIPADDRTRFINLLAGLARSSLVWVIATMRKDFWHRADETPELARLSTGNGRLELLPPTPAQVSQMIRRPAEAAGLSFEVNSSTGIPLNEVIAEEVAREPGALPLLSYLLDQLYRADVLEARGHALTFATYERLGRLEGAIAAKAEAVLGRCGPDERAALGSVLFALVQLGVAEGDVGRAVARRAPISVFAEGTPQRRLVEALLNRDARLLSSDAGVEGNPTVRVAHEALITHWPRAREFVLSNAAALKVRRRVEERYVLWREAAETGGAGGEASPPHAGLLGRVLAVRRSAGHEKGLLTEIDLADGRRLLADHRSEIEPHIADYIERSIVADERERSRLVRSLATVASVVTALAIAATAAALVAHGRTQQALAAQSRLLTSTAEQRIQSGDPAGAMAIVLDILTNPRWGGKRPAAAVSVFQEARANDRLVTVLAGHSDGIEYAEFSPNGGRVLTASDDKTARVWDVTTATVVRTLRSSGVFISARFSPGGRRIVTASSDRTARVWDANTGIQSLVLTGHTGAIEFATFSPDGRRIATASFDGTARVWDARSGKLLTVFSGHHGPVLSAMFSPDGSKVVSASLDRTAMIWSASTGAVLSTLRGHTGGVEFAVFSPNGQQVATSSEDDTARTWNATTGAPLMVFRGHREAVQCVTYSPSGDRLLTASVDRTARIWDVSTARLLSSLTGHQASLHSAEYSADGRHIVTASDDATARVWDVDSALQEKAFPGHSGLAAYSPDGRRIVAANPDNTAQVWDTQSGTSLAILSGHTAPLDALAFSPDGRWIATASDDKTARLWDAYTGTQVTVFAGHAGGLHSVAFSRDGRRVVTGSFDRTARIWDSQTGTLLAVLRGHTAGVMSAKFSPDGQHIVTSSLDRTARIWDARTGKQEAIISPRAGGLLDASYSPDNSKLVIASDDGTARVWSAKTIGELVVLRGHRYGLRAAEFSPAGDLILTASGDGTARIWSPSGVQLVVLSSNGSSVDSSSFSPDGRHVLSASFDGIVRIWNARVPADLEDQISWAKAAQADGLSETDRAELGLLSPTTSLSIPAVLRSFTDAARTAEKAAQEGEVAESRAVGNIWPIQAPLLIQALNYYTIAAPISEDDVSPSPSSKTWRYKRAALARILAHRGMMREAAEAAR